MNLLFPSDKEELALTLGGKKRNIKRLDFDQFAAGLGIADIVRNNIYKDFSKQLNRSHDLINKSFLSTEYKQSYIGILNNKFKQLNL